MNVERQKHAESLFLEAIALDPVARDAFLHERVAGDAALLDEVRSLLRFAADAGPMDGSGPKLAGMIDDDETPGLLPAGRRVGPYTITRVLGVGGMGVVYVAEQVSPRRTVALKVIRPGLATPSVLRRFEFEVEVLGRLQHAGIAQIIEAGTADTGFGPQPFFALELIDGRPLTAHCVERSLGVRERIGLMIRICAAVEHAHQRGVIHRDLKPGNILVDTSGQPKILDFGVARAVGGRDNDQRLTMLRTGEKQLVGTLAYMSPEQVSGDPEAVDTRSDVYALGVILFELLSGVLPHDLSKASLAAAVRTIREDDPARLGTLKPEHRGDIETITGKALERDVARRYASAAELGADLQRFLDDAPINARPPTAVYTLKKFASRHRALVAGVALAMLSLSAGLVVSVVARNRALLAGSRSDQMARFLERTLLSIDPQVARGRDSTLLREVMAQTIVRLDSDELASQPALRGELYSLVGEIERRLGQPAVAAPLLERGLALIETGSSGPTIEASIAQRRLGDTRMMLGDLDGASTSYEAADQMARELGSANESLRAQLGRAGVSRQRDERADAIRRLEPIVTGVEALTPGDPDLLAQAKHDLGVTLSDSGDHVAAQALILAAIDIRERSHGADDPTAGGYLTNLGADQHVAGEYDKAVATYRRALAIQEKMLGDAHPYTLNTRCNLALTLTELSQNEEAARLVESAVAIERVVLKNKGPALGNHLALLGSVRRFVGDNPGSIAAFQEALPIIEAALGVNHTFAIDVMQSMAITRTAMGDHRGAAECYESAIARITAAETTDPDWLKTLTDMRAQALAAAGAE